MKEYCEREYFEAVCGENEVIVIDTAVYGRMKVGRCVSHEYGSIGCQATVVHLLDMQCSGRQQCRFHTSELHAAKSCPTELIAYLEASYHCVTGDARIFS